MTGRQKLILAVLAVFVGTGSCAVVALLILRWRVPSDSGIVTGVTPTSTARPTLTPTWMPRPTWTPSSTETPLPLQTATRVVQDTATSTAAPTPTNTLVVPTTPIGPTIVGTRSTPRPRTPTATPTPSHPFKLAASQVYVTSNWFFVLYAQIKTGGALLAGYRVVGTHIPSGSTFESAPSCSDLCKASGPRVSTTPCCNESCTPEAASLPANVQEGNVALEAPIYDTGTYYIRVLDPQGQQVSDTIEIPIDINDRKWFFYVFAR